MNSSGDTEKTQAEEQNRPGNQVATYRVRRRDGRSWPPRSGAIGLERWMSIFRYCPVFRWERKIAAALAIFWI